MNNELDPALQQLFSQASGPLEGERFTREFVGRLEREVSRRSRRRYAFNLLVLTLAGTVPWLLPEVSLVAQRVLGGIAAWSTAAQWLPSLMLSAAAMLFVGVRRLTRREA